MKINDGAKVKRTTRRLKWQLNSLVSIRLKDDLHTIGQMLESPFMQFFKISRPDSAWSNLDLSDIEPIFCVPIGNVVLENLVEYRIINKSVKPSILQVSNFWIKPHLNFDGGFPFKGGRLIKRVPDVDLTNSPVLKQNLSWDQDREIILKHELTNMWGAEDLAERLKGIFETGRDQNWIKNKVFGVQALGAIA